ncbi:hypothetical protein [Cohnella kolymensis]|uniref:hypothetical protein n=1 Tax=Cohnella kolymensis TaxID=1590652 RepID=UPI0006978BA5|nr:hypothetical protein [Cohnella kolymensis]
MRKRVYCGAAILMVVLLFHIVCNEQFVAYGADIDRNNSITLIIRSSPDALWATRHNIRISGIEQALKNAKRERPVFSPYLTDAYVNVPKYSKQTILRIELSGDLWDEQEGERLILPEKFAKKLLTHVRLLRGRHYGELKDWTEADRLVFRKSVFSVKDLETGLTFRVQRRAGSDHADVQPVSREDTNIMKRIYEHGWSWKRRAILVLMNGRSLAASMHGMPHGGDGIPDNGFSGHFCIHFLNSTTHGSDEPDPAHQLMVHKAAGTLRPYLNSASARLFTLSVAEAMKQQDPEIVRLLLEGIQQEKSASLANELDSLSYIKKIRQPAHEQMEDPDAATMEFQIEMQQKERAGTTELAFVIQRYSPASPWRVQDLSINR